MLYHGYSRQPLGLTGYMEHRPFSRRLQTQSLDLMNIESLSFIICLVPILSTSSDVTMGVPMASQHFAHLSLRHSSLVASFAETKRYNPCLLALITLFIKIQFTFCVITFFALSQTMAAESIRDEAIRLETGARNTRLVLPLTLPYTALLQPATKPIRSAKAAHSERFFKCSLSRVKARITSGQSPNWAPYTAKTKSAPRSQA